MDKFWDRFDESVVKPLLGIKLRIVASYENSILGAKIKRTKDIQMNSYYPGAQFTEYLILQKLSHSHKYNQDTEFGNISHDNSLRFKSTIDKKVDLAIDEIYPTEPKYLKIYVAYISTSILCFYTIINLTQYLFDLEELKCYKPVVDCIFPGRLIWTGSIAHKGRFYTSILIVIYTILKVNQFVKTEPINLDLLEFLLMPEKDVIKSIFNCNKYNYCLADSSHIYSAFNEYLNNKSHEKLRFNSTFHIRLPDDKIIPKLNRDLTGRLILKRFARAMTILLLFLVSIYTSCIIVYVILFSLTLEGDFLAYPHCSKWRLRSTSDAYVLQMNYTDPDLIGYRVPSKKLRLNDPIIFYHTLGNLMFNFWYICDIVIFFTSFITITVMIPIDTGIYCLRLRHQLQQLAIRANNPKLFNQEGTKFLAHSLRYQLYTYFDQIKRYNVLIAKLSLVVILLNLVINCLSIGATLITGSLLDDLEIYLVSGEILLATVIVFTSMEIVRKLSLDLYPHISTLCVSRLDNETRLKYTNLLSYYSRPTFCFSLYYSELSLFFFIKNVSFILTVIAFVYNITITRSHSANTRYLEKLQINQSINTFDL